MTVLSGADDAAHSGRLNAGGGGVSVGGCAPVHVHIPRLAGLVDVY